MAATQPAKVSAEAARPAKSPGEAPPPTLSAKAIDRAVYARAPATNGA